MTLLSRIVEKWAGLPPAVTHDVAVERDLRIPMPDGVTLLADRYAPRGVANPPLLLVRSPYGRRLFFGFLYGRLYAERGFQVVVQSCRGTFGSGEVPFVPNFHERADGLATVEWLRAQPWYPGRFGTVGPSYLGFVQWAIASARLPDHVAMAIQMAPHEFQSVTHPDGSFALETTLGWARMVNGQSERGLLANLRHMRREKRELAPAFAEVPLATSYLRATQSRVAFFEDWLAHEAPDDPWWKPIDFAAALPEIETPVLLVGGWFDLFARHTIAQWSGLAAGGRAPRMLIGPWQHMDLTMRWAAIFQESLAFLRSELCGEARPEKCVRLFVMGADEWREYPSWPPPGTREQRLYLHDGGALGDGPPAAAGVDHQTAHAARRQGRRQQLAEISIVRGRFGRDHQDIARLALFDRDVQHPVVVGWHADGDGAARLCGRSGRSGRRLARFGRGAGGGPCPLGADRGAGRRPRRSGG